jgi:hypothetical protein
MADPPEFSLRLSPDKDILAYIYPDGTIWYHFLGREAIKVFSPEENSLTDDKRLTTRCTKLIWRPDMSTWSSIDEVPPGFS